MIGSRTNRAGAALLATLLAALAATVANAQDTDWPTRNIRLIINSAPGSAADTTGRIVSQKLTERLGWTIVNENQAAASGRVGAAAVARAAPDGYTIGIITASTHSVTAALGIDMPYDPVTSFAPVAHDRKLALRARGLSGHRLSHARRSGRRREGEAGATQQRDVRARKRRRHGERLARGAGGHPAQRDLLSQHRASGRRRRRRTRRHAVRYAAADRAADQRGPHPRHRHHRPQARAGAARGCDLRRAGLSEFRSRAVAGDRGAGRHAARDRGAAQPRDQRGRCTCRRRRRRCSMRASRRSPDRRRCCSRASRTTSPSGRRWSRRRRSGSSDPLLRSFPRKRESRRAQYKCRRKCGSPPSRGRAGDGARLRTTTTAARPSSAS